MNSSLSAKPEKVICHGCEAPKRPAALARAFAASTSRSRGGALVTSEARSSCAAYVTWSTARLKAGSLALEGRAEPLDLRLEVRGGPRAPPPAGGGVWVWRRLRFRRHGGSWAIT